MIIKLTNTTLGLAVNGIIRPKTPDDLPFEVSDELGIRLIEEHKAVSVFISEPDMPDISDTDIPKTDGAAETAAPDSDTPDIPEYNEFTTKAVLQSIANDHGIEIPANATKQELLKALDNFFANDEPEE